MGKLLQVMWGEKEEGLDCCFCWELEHFVRADEGSVSYRCSRLNYAEEHAFLQITQLPGTILIGV